VSIFFECFNATSSTWWTAFCVSVCTPYWKCEIYVRGFVELIQIKTFLVPFVRVPQLHQWQTFQKKKVVVLILAMIHRFIIHGRDLICASCALILSLDNQPFLFITGESSVECGGVRTVSWLSLVHHDSSLHIHIVQLYGYSIFFSFCDRLWTKDYKQFKEFRIVLQPSSFCNGWCLGEQGWVIRFQDFSSSFSSCKKLPSVEDSWRLCRGDVVIRMWSTIFFFGFVLFLGRRGKNTKLARTIQIDGLSVNSFFFLVELPHSCKLVRFLIYIIFYSCRRLDLDIINASKAEMAATGKI
jgi:hypothetical protein